MFCISLLQINAAFQDLQHFTDSISTSIAVTASTKILQNGLEPKNDLKYSNDGLGKLLKKK